MRAAAGEWLTARRRLACAGQMVLRAPGVHCNRATRSFQRPAAWHSAAAMRACQRKYTAGVLPGTAESECVCVCLQCWRGGGMLANRPALGAGSAHEVCVSKVMRYVADRAMLKARPRHGALLPPGGAHNVARCAHAHHPMQYPEQDATFRGLSRFAKASRLHNVAHATGCAPPSEGCSEERDGRLRRDFACLRP